MGQRGGAIGSQTSPLAPTRTATWAMRFLVRYLRTVGVLLALVVMWAYFAFASSYFFTRANIFNILLQAANVGIVAAGLTVVMIAGEIDLSIGSLEALSGAVAAVAIIQYHVPAVLGIALALLATTLAGALSGLITWKLRVVSFISTLAMLGVAQGIAFLLTNGQAVAGFPSGYDNIGAGTIDGFPIAALIAAAVFVVLHLLLTRTKFGLHVYAVGGNAEAAAWAGIRPQRIKFIAFLISGLTGGIGGLILSSRLDAGNGLFGAGDLLNAVAAVVIGGTSLFGGIGTVLGTAIGVIMISTIYDGMVLLNIPDFWQQIAVGCIIVGAMVIDQVAKAVGAQAHG